VRTLPPRLYDLVQVLLGQRTSLARLAPHFERLGGGAVIDVGGGTGLYGRHLPNGTRYICVDNDRQKLQRARATHSCCVQCDATRLALRSKSVDYGICIGVAHHLADDAWHEMLREIARVVRRRLIFVDPVIQRRLSISDLLWRLDAGSYPRSESRLLEDLSAEFVCEQVESYHIHHRYLVCIAAPRAR
jgi:ubiquinone/menaquinone biosynthesis C-methylase UbiE